LRFKFKAIFNQLIRQHSRPQDIALGAAIGAFISVLPVYGLHTVLVIIAAVIVKPANKIAILLGTNLSLPITLPFITWVGYETGRFILKGNFPPLNWGFFHQLTFQKIISFYQPLFLGSVILGLVCAIIVYGFTFWVVKMIRQRKRHDSGNNYKEIQG
jgi:uncharacterized protein (DUF2062 family)